MRSFMGLGNNLVAVYNGVGEHFKKIEDFDVLKLAKAKYKYFRGI